MSHIRGFPKLRVPFGDPYRMDFNILGSMLGSLEFGREATITTSRKKDFYHTHELWDWGFRTQSNTAPGNCFHMDLLCMYKALSSNADRASSQFVNGGFPKSGVPYWGAP